jgi:hypothetical protein
MKSLLSLLCLFLVACSTTAPAPVESLGKFVILEYSMPGQVKQSWTVTQYHETEFPRTVTFVYGGETITLRGSYQISEFLP